MDQEWTWTESGPELDNLALEHLIDTLRYLIFSKKNLSNSFLKVQRFNTFYFVSLIVFG